MSYYKSHDNYDSKKHRHFSIKVTDYNDDFSVFDVFGHDSLSSEASVYQSCISFPKDDIMMVWHDGGISLFGTYKQVDIYVQREPTNE